MFNPIPTDSVAVWEDAVEPLIARLVNESRGTLTEEAVWGQIVSGEWYLAIVSDGKTVVILDEYTTPAGVKVLEIVGIAGENMADWAEAARGLESIARGRGVHRLRACGRVGWGREAKKFGWKMTRAVVEKDLYNA